MQTQYRFATYSKDPILTAQLPRRIYHDLKQKAIENGRTLEVELMIRLARSLEKDAEMIEQDKLIENIFTVAYRGEEKL